MMKCCYVATTHIIYVHIEHKKTERHLVWRNSLSPRLPASSSKLHRTGNINQGAIVIAQWVFFFLFRPIAYFLCLHTHTHKAITAKNDKINGLLYFCHNEKTNFHFTICVMIELLGERMPIVWFFFYMWSRNTLENKTGECAMTFFHL